LPAGVRKAEWCDERSGNLAANYGGSDDDVLARVQAAVKALKDLE
jgi:hypothetical protein